MIWTGFLMGIMSSMHCVGMCGPIALALPVPPGIMRIIAILVYNIGRVITYSILGSVAGFIGYIFVIVGFQSYLSIVCGILVLITALFSLTNISVRGHFNKLPNLFIKFKNQFTKFFNQRTLGSLFLIGLLNGLLPCGMIYMVMTGAIAMGTSIGGGMYMFLFGLGTIPLMFMITYLKELNWKGRQTFRYMVPVISMMVGILLIIRGLNLNIPYVSPAHSDTEVTCCGTTKCH